MVIVVALNLFARVIVTGLDGAGGAMTSNPSRPENFQPPDWRPAEAGVYSLPVSPHQPVSPPSYET